MHLRHLPVLLSPGRALLPFLDPRYRATGHAGEEAKVNCWEAPTEVTQLSPPDARDACMHAQPCPSALESPTAGCGCEDD